MRSKKGPNTKLLVVFSLWIPGQHYLLLAAACDNTHSIMNRSLWCPEFLLGFTHKLLVRLTLTFQPLLEVWSAVRLEIITDKACSKAPILNHIVRLPIGQSTQANRDILIRQGMPGAQISPLRSLRQMSESSLEKVNSSLHSRILL